MTLVDCKSMTGSRCSMQVLFRRGKVGWRRGRLKENSGVCKVAYFEVNTLMDRRSQNSKYVEAWLVRG
jgi:hypothetical protein